MTQHRSIHQVDDDAAGLSSAPATPWRWVVPTALVGFIFVAYISALRAGFVDWDDNRLIDEAERYDPLSWTHLRWALTTSFSGHFQPLTWLSLGLDYELWGLYDFYYHRTSVAWHVLTALVFYFVARRLIALGFGALDRERSGPFVWSAAMATVLFAVHPLRAESVVWIAERRDVLSGAFYMLCVFFYLRYTARSGSRSRWGSYAAAIVMCMLSLSAKATAATIGLVLLVLDVYPLRRVGGHAHASDGDSSAFAGRDPACVGMAPDAGVSVRRVLLEKVPFLLLGLAAGVRAIVAQRDGGALYTLSDRDVLSRFAQAIHGLVFYVWKTIWPMNLGPLYQLPAREELLGPSLWFSAAAVVIAVVAVVKLRRRLPALAAATAVYVVVVFPVLGFFQSGPQLVADRYSYLSCMGFAVAAGAGLVWITERYGRRVLVGLAACLLAAVLARASIAQQDVWNTGRTLWARAVLVSPESSIVRVEYGRALFRYGDIPSARRELERGLELDPDDAVGWHSLGNVNRRYRGAAAVDRTIECYRRAMELDPRRRFLHFSLATIIAERKGGGVEAARILREGLALFPDDVRMMAYLAELLGTYPDPTARDAERGLVWARRVADLRGKPVDFMVLATALAETGHFDEAVAAGEDCLLRARENEDSRLVREIQRRLDLFRAGRGIFDNREDPPTATTESKSTP